MKERETMSTLDDLRREKHVFHQSYSNLCSLKSLAHLSIRCQHLDQLDFHVDHISLDEWSPILMSLSRDQSLTYIALRCRFHCADILEDVDSEVSCLAVNKRPLIFTRYLLLHVIDALCGCLRHNTQLTCLTLDGILLDVEYLHGLCQGIATCKTLEKLSVRNCEVRDEGVAVLCDTLRHMSHVTLIDLSQCGLTGKGATTVARLVGQQKELRSRRGWTSEGGYGEEYFLGLQRITLNHNFYVGDVGCKSLMDVIKDDNWIKALDFQNCGLTDASAVRALEILDKNSFISVLDMRSNTISLCLLKQITLSIRALTTPDCDWLKVEKCARPKQPGPLLAQPTKTKTGDRSMGGDSVRSRASLRGSSIVSCGPDTSNMNPGPRSMSVRSGNIFKGSSIVSCGPDTSNMNPGPRSMGGDSVRSGNIFKGSSIISCGPDTSNMNPGARSMGGDPARSGNIFKGSSLISCGPDTSNMNPGPRSMGGDSVRSGNIFKGSSLISCGPDTSNMNPGARSMGGDFVRSGNIFKGSSLISCGPDPSNASTLHGISEIASCYSHATDHAQYDHDVDSMYCDSLADTDVSLLVCEDEIRTRNDEVQLEMEKVRQARRRVETMNEASAASVTELERRVERERAMRRTVEQETEILQERIDRLSDMVERERDTNHDLKANTLIQ